MALTYSMRKDSPSASIVLQVRGAMLMLRDYGSIVDLRAALTMDAYVVPEESADPAFEYLASATLTGHGGNPATETFVYEATALQVGDYTEHRMGTEPNAIVDILGLRRTRARSAIASRSRAASPGSRRSCARSRASRMASAASSGCAAPVRRG